MNGTKFQIKRSCCIDPMYGEICYPAVYRKLAELGYTGYVGYELFPLTTTDEAVRRIFAE